MLKLALAPNVAKRLDRFVRGDDEAIRSDHWRRYGRLNRIRVRGDRVEIEAGAGFDSEYELNFRSATAKELAGALWRSAIGRNDVQLYRNAYQALWSEAPPDVPSPHQIIARHYLRFLAALNPQSYLEIGAGTGYLAALVHGKWRSKITIIDLPEVLPFSFLYLHTLFPDVPFVLPGEKGLATFTFLTSGDSVIDDSMDLAVNTASFGEMRPEIIHHYFRLLRRSLKSDGIFFTVNREQKWMDGVAIRFVDYPWADDDVDLLFGPSKLHAITQPRSPMLLRLCRLAKRANA